MSQEASGAEFVQVNRKSLWVAAVGLLLLSIGAVGMGWFPGYDRFNFTLQALGPLAIAVALLIEWRTHVERRGWAALVLFILAIITYGALWVPYAINPASLGTTEATQLGSSPFSSITLLSDRDDVLCKRWSASSPSPSPHVTPITSRYPQLLHHHSLKLATAASVTNFDSSVAISFNSHIIRYNIGIMKLKPVVISQSSASAPLLPPQPAALRYCESIGDACAACAACASAGDDCACAAGWDVP